MITGRYYFLGSSDEETEIYIPKRQNLWREWTNRKWQTHDLRADFVLSPRLVLTSLAWSIMDFSVTLSEHEEAPFSPKLIAPRPPRSGFELPIPFPSLPWKRHWVPGSALAVKLQVVEERPLVAKPFPRSNPWSRCSPREIGNPVLGSSCVCEACTSDR